MYSKFLESAIIQLQAANPNATSTDTTITAADQAAIDAATKAAQDAADAA